MDTPLEPPPLSSAPTPPRHGCVTAWLIFMIVVNALTAIGTPFSLNSLRQAGMHPSVPLIGVLVVCAVANIVFAVALLRWMKWGFYGFAATTVIALVVNLILGVGLGSSLLGLIGIAILYGVLNVGQANKAWPRLK